MYLLNVTTMKVGEKKSSGINSIWTMCVVADTLRFFILFGI